MDILDITFADWLELDEVARFYYNQKTVDKWLPTLVEKAADKALEIAARNPTSNWMRYNLPYWQEHRDELIQKLMPMGQEWFDYNPGTPYSSMVSRLVIAAGQIFQKGPYTRRHIAYAHSLGKHPDEVEKRKAGVVAGAVRGPYKRQAVVQ